MALVGFSKREMINYLFGFIADYDVSTAIHSYKVQDLATRFAVELRLSPESIRRVSDAAILHDIGKIRVPKAILNKPEALTADEWDCIKQHPRLARDFLCHIEELSPVLEAIFSHHEKYNGTGYPEGRSGEDIPLIARILAIVDVYEALTAERPYRKALDYLTALTMIKDGKGSHFDPCLTDLFLQYMSSENGMLTNERAIVIEKMVAGSKIITFMKACD